MKLGMIAALAVAGVASADFTGYSVTADTVGNLTKYTLFGNFNGATDTVLNAFHISLVSGSTTFYHADALNGGVSSTVAGTWNPQFVLVPGAMDSYVCIGGGEGFASGNSTAADPDWGVAGFNAAQIPYGNGNTNGPGWFNQNPPNLQGRVNANGQVKLGQFVIASADEANGATIFLKVGYRDGKGPIQFGDGTFPGLCCDADCDADGTPDSIQIAENPSLDCDTNGRIDSCDILYSPGLDCEGNGVLDVCEFVDCDENGTHDGCDIAIGFDSDDNANGVPDACEFPVGDLNRDGIVSAGDFSMLLTAWGSIKPNLADLNRDGVVDAADMTLLLDNWGATN